MTASSPQTVRPNLRSIGLITLVWLILQVGGLFSPGLLDDVDSVYLEIAREMLHRHDFVTPYIDGIRFFDKPPLMYWLAAGSMHLFGEHDWAGRIPLALAVLALLLATYFLGLRLYAQASPASAPDRAAFYSALALATAIGPYLYTRFYIPDILIALWMTLGVHLFLLALDRIPTTSGAPSSDDGRIVGQGGVSGGNPTVLSSPSTISVILSERSESKDPEELRPADTDRPTSTGTLSPGPSSLVPSLAFAATLALNLLTKGLIGLVFPLAFVFLYLVFTRQLKLLPKLHPLPSALVFAAIALPWHILAALRNPAILMPPGLGLPTRAGWAWFYLYNEHFARFLGKRIPHDYGNTPVWLFWLYAAIWIFPWITFLPTFLPAAIATLRDHLGHHRPVTARQREAAYCGEGDAAVTAALQRARASEAALTVTLWTLIVLVFFSISNRQEYYSLPAIPALALMAGSILARADKALAECSLVPSPSSLVPSHRFFLLPLSLLIALLTACFALTAPHPAPGSDLFTVLNQNTANYNLSLGHLFDLTGPAMGFFRLPLALTALGMAILGPVSYALRARSKTYAANLTLAAGMTLVLLAAHEGLVRFNPILGSKDLAQAILREEQLHPEPSLILLDGELTSGSTLLFYTRQPVHLVNGRINGPWFGSFWPDAPPIFENDETLHALWSGPRRLFLLTYSPQDRTRDLLPYGAVRSLAQSGGKTILTNH